MKKTLIFILCSVSLFLLFAIPSFASVDDGFAFRGESFTFNESLSEVPLSTTFSVYFECNGISYSSISFSYRGYLSMSYDDTEVYYRGWNDESYRTITFTSDQFLPFELSSFLVNNELPASTYSSAFNLLKDAIYGSGTITDNQSFVITLIATVFSVLVVALPVIVIYILIKFFVGTIARY